MEKLFHTVSMAAFEPDGEVTYWVNPPSGVVRGFQRALARLKVPSNDMLGRQPATLEEMRKVLDAAENAFEVEDAVWASILRMIDKWSLKGYGDEVLPVSQEGLDELPGPERLALLDKLQEALEAVARLDPRRGVPSSNTKPEESAPQEAPSNLREIHASSQNHPESFTG